MNRVDIKVRLDDGAYMPTKGHTFDGGLDLRCKEDVDATCMDTVVIDTGVHMIIPNGYAGIIIGRSGLHMKDSIFTQGLIDSDYTGSIKVRLHTDDIDTLHFCAGDKIAQIVIVEVPFIHLSLDYIQHSEPRRDNGFGSTGR